MEADAYAVGAAVAAGGGVHVHKDDILFSVFLFDLPGQFLCDLRRVGVAYADAVILDANHDPELLRCGPYPPHLKRRILSDHGHLSNVECAEALRDFVHPGLRNIFLCHLSEHNNTPELAYETNAAVLQACYAEAEGRIPRLCPLPRMTPSPFFIL